MDRAAARSDSDGRGKEPGREPGKEPGRERARESLALLAERSRPVASSQTRLLPVLPPLADLFPDGSVRRGSTIVVDGLSGNGVRTPGGAHSPGATHNGDISLALALVAAASAAGSWCGVIGLIGLGAVAAHDIGIDLDRLALIPRPGAAWAEVTAAVIDGLDLVVLCPPFPPRRAMARRLVARTRERRSVLVVVPGRAGWPECPDLQLAVSDVSWEGIGPDGAGYLEQRRMTVTATGRRSATRPRRRHLLLPSAVGAVTTATGAETPGDRDVCPAELAELGPPS